MSMQSRNLLYVELRFGWYKDAYEDMRKLVRQQAGCLHFLRKFRTKPGPYLTWRSCGYHGGGLHFIGFTVRLKCPYDTDYVVPAFRDLPHVKHIETSWFPSREPYGGIVQTDGSIIESWDI